MNNCPICKLDAEYFSSKSLGGTLEIDCARCGKYQITFSAKAIADADGPNYALAAWLRAHTWGSEPPRLNSENMLELPKGFPTYRVADKQLIFMREIERRTNYAGMHVQVVQKFDFPLAWCTSIEELNYIIRALLGRDLLRLETYQDPKDSFTLELTITPRGWDYLDAAAKTISIEEQAFVAMAFAADLRPAWEDAIRPALLKAGYKPLGCCRFSRHRPKLLELVRTVSD